MNKKGFTLIELLVVIAVIGLLASIVMVATNSVRSKARNVKRLSDIQQYLTAIEMAYDASNGASYPNPGDTAWHCLGDYGDNLCWLNGIDLGESAILNGILDDYISSLPADEMLICGFGGVSTNCYEGYLYHCTETNCHTIEFAWFMEGDDQSCGVGYDNGNICANCTFCWYKN